MALGHENTNFLSPVKKENIFGQQGIVLKESKGRPRSYNKYLFSCITVVNTEVTKYNNVMYTRVEYTKMSNFVFCILLHWVGHNVTKNAK